MNFDDVAASFVKLAIGALVGAWLNNFFGLRPMATKLGEIALTLAVLQNSVSRTEQETERRLAALEERETQ